MPIGKYFKGNGNKVMSDMKDRYGEKKGEQVFYATANKRDMKPSDNDGDEPPAPKKRKTFGQRIGGK